MTSNYAAWDINENDFPIAGSGSDKVRFMLGYGVLAPNTHNTQPWKFEALSDNKVKITPDWSKVLPFSDPSNRGMFISLGCCVLNIMTAADHFGWAVEYSVEGEAPLSSYVLLMFHLRDEAVRSEPNLGKLLPFITGRQSHKMPFQEGAIPDQAIQALSLITFNDARVVVTTDSRSKDLIAHLHLASTMKFSKNRGFRREVSRWMRASSTERFDGMPGSTFGLSNVPSLLAKYVTKIVPSSVKIVAKKDFVILRDAPALGVVVTHAEGPLSWVSAGMVYQQAGLTMAAEEILLAPKAATIEVGCGRELAMIFGATGIPQLYFGLGYGDGIQRHSPRRSSDHVLIGHSDT